MQKTDHSQFTSFVLSEFKQITHPKKPGYNTYFIWIGCLIIPIIVLILGVIDSGNLDRVITALLYDLFQTNLFFQAVGNILQYTYFVALVGALVSLIIVIILTCLIIKSESGRLKEVEKEKKKLTKSEIEALNELRKLRRMKNKAGK